MQEKRILIVEDERITAYDIQKTLEENGLAVSGICASGRECLARTGEDPPDLILMDITLQKDMDGIETARRVTRDRDIPVIFLTAHGDRATVEEASGVLTYGYITKPIKANDLFIAVTTALFRHEADVRIRESERRYRELVENAHSIILRLSPEGAITFINDYGVSFFGYTGDELTGRTLQETIIPDSRSTLDELRRIALEIHEAPEAFTGYENEYIKKNGSRAWISWSIHVVTGDSGEAEEILCVGHDVTRRRRAEEKFETIFYSSPDPMVIVRLGERVVTDVNDAYLAYTGHDYHDIVGQKSRHLPVDGDVLEEMNRLLGEEGRVANLETDFVSPARAGRILLSSDVIDLDGEPHSLTTIREITEMSELRQRLQQTNRQLQDIVEFLPDATLVIDREGTVIAWNRALERMTGAPKEEMLGKGDYEHAIPFYGVRRPILADHALKGSMDTEGFYDSFKREGDTIFAESLIEALYLTKKPVYFWGKASPLYDADGNVAGAIESVRDISDLKAVERSLRESEARYRAMFEATGTAMVMEDEAGTIILVNREFVELTGYSEDEIQGRMNRNDFLIEEDRNKSARYHRGIREGLISIPHYDEVRITTRKGETRHIYVIVTLIPGTDTSIASLIDITEIKRLEKEVLEISMREQQRIGRDLHDGLGQILTGVGFLMDSVIRRVSKGTVVEEKDMRQIKDLVTQAMDHTRALSRGMSPVDVKSGGLRAALSRLSADTERLFGITCAFSMDEEIEIDDMMTETQLYYIANESIHNAIKHGKADEIVIEIDDDRDTLRVSISDNGTGFPDEEGDDTGIGMQLMRYRARVIGADLYFESEGGGVTVRCLAKKDTR